jgi:hypothetical protein
MAEMRPGIFMAGFARLSAEGEIKGRLGLEELAHAVEKQAKINASNGRHAYGTPTPARRGEGPARISGTLVRSVDHSPITKEVGGWYTKVGPRTGETNPNGKTPPDVYGYYLETKLGFPWLKPAAEFATKISAFTIFNKKYGAGGWLRVF